VQLKHAAAKTHAVFDEPNLAPRAGLVPVMRLAERVGLSTLAGEHVHPDGPAGANPDIKIGCLVAGMAAGADSVDDMDLLREGATPELFTEVRAPSTLGSFIRSFTWGSSRQLDKVHRLLLARLAAGTPLLPDAETLAFLDVDSSQRRVYGYAKQGAGFGHTKVAGRSVLVRGLNVLTATVSTPLSTPVVAGMRLRGGTAASVRGAPSFLREAVGTARAAGATGTILARFDSAFYTGDVVATCRRLGVHFSITARHDPKVMRTIAAIPEQAWTPIRYPRAVYDEETEQWVSEAEITEIEYTAFASKAKHRTTARLLVRRVENRDAAPDDPEWRHHAVFTDSPFVLAEAEPTHRGHAVCEQVFSDLADGPLAHLPSGSFAANAAWATLAAMTYNLTHAAGTLAGVDHDHARLATLRDELVNVPGVLAHHGRGDLVVHLPERWPAEPAWQALFDATHRLPPARAG
jgi:hypothetical protein